MCILGQDRLNQDQHAIQQISESTLVSYDIVTYKVDRAWVM